MGARQMIGRGLQLIVPRRGPGIREIAALMLGWLVASGNAGAVPPQEIERLEAPLAQWLTDRTRQPVGSIVSLAEDYARAGPFRSLIRAAVAGDWPAAAASARQAHYRLFVLTDATGWYLILDDAMNGLGPTVVLAPEARRDMIAEAPHPVFDGETVQETAVFVTHLGARAAVVAGTHRCAAARETSCSGKTSVCRQWGKAAYRDSDVAHNTESLFHAAHEALAAQWPGAVVVSIHGFEKRRSAPETWVVLSDGGSAESGDTGSLTRRLRDRLRAMLGEGDARAVACDDVADRRFGYPRLCATNNVQGRHVNASGDACRKGVTRGNGRFLHIEQTRDVRDAFATSWRAPYENQVTKAVLDAFTQIIPCLPGRCP